MSIKTRLTLNNVIYEFQTLIDSHLMINSFYYGNFLTIYESNTIKYSTLLMNVNNATVDEHYYHLTVELMTMDKVFKDISNRIDVESDSLSNLQDVFSVIKTSNRWQSFSKITQQSQMRKFVNKGEDQVTGWAMTLQLSIKRKNGICDLPIEGYDYEGEYTPTCPGVSIYENEIFVEVVPAGGRYDYSSVCDPVNIQINGVEFVDAPSGSTQNLSVVDRNDNAIGSKVDDKWVVPLSTDVYYNKPLYLQEDSYYDYDEGYWKANGINDYMDAIPENSIIQQIAPDLKDRLIYNNMYGNKFRLSGIDGGYYNPDDGLYYDKFGVETDETTAFPRYSGNYFFIVDHLSGGLWFGIRAGQDSFTGSLTSVEARNGTAIYDFMTGFSVPSRTAAEQFMDTRYGLNMYPSERLPFRLNQPSYWTCTVALTDTGYGILYRVTNDTVGVGIVTSPSGNRWQYKHNYLTGTVQNTVVNDD